jgi:hypothetical protein
MLVKLANINCHESQINGGRVISSAVDGQTHRQTDITMPLGSFLTSREHAQKTVTLFPCNGSLSLALKDSRM